jgi:hypothetical protein
MSFFDFASFVVTSSLSLPSNATLRFGCLCAENRGTVAGKILSPPVNPEA